MVDGGQDYLQQIINLNFYSDANLLQLNMEQQLVKQTGTLFAPPGKYKLIYYVEDLNIPATDT
jgi:dynein heavy chain